MLTSLSIAAVVLVLLPSATGESPRVAAAA